MKKKWLVVGMTCVTSLVLVACTPASQTSEESKQTAVSEVSQAEFTLELKEDGETFSNETLVIKEGESLMSLMAEQHDIGEENGMIMEIDGHKSDSQADKYWLYEVNGEMPDVGANEYFPQKDDKIVWELKELEIE